MSTTDETVTVDLLGRETRGTIVRRTCRAAYNNPPHDDVTVDVDGSRWVVDEDDISR